MAQLNEVDLVLLGGGHAHVEVLRCFANKPFANTRLTLISDRSEAPYSGMLPALLMERYSHQQTHFNLHQLTARGQVGFIQAEVCGIDAKNRLIQLAGAPPISFDLVSINVGSQPALIDAPADSSSSQPTLMPLKPIYKFLPRWQQLINQLQQLPASATPHIAMVGGGVGGVEVALALANRSQKMRCTPKIQLFQSGPSLLATHPPEVRSHISSILKCSNIDVQLNTEIHRLHQGEVSCRQSGLRYPADFVLLATEASAASWLAESSLPVDERGFVKIGADLRVLGTQRLFAVGDCCHFHPRPLPKAGVFAVRQGKVLAYNLRTAAQNLLKQNHPSSDLKKYRPQTKALALITTGPREALMSYSIFGRPLCWKGRLLGSIKTAIDMRFMRRFQKMPLSHSNQFLYLHDQNQPSFPQPIIPSNPPPSWDGVSHHTTQPVPWNLRDPYLQGRVAGQHSLQYAPLHQQQNQVGAYLTLRHQQGKSPIKANDIERLVEGFRSVLNQNGVALLGGQVLLSPVAEIAVEWRTRLTPSPQTLAPSKTFLAPSKTFPKEICLVVSAALGSGALLEAAAVGELGAPEVEQLHSRLSQNQMSAGAILSRFTAAPPEVIGLQGLGSVLIQSLAKGNNLKLQLDYSNIPKLPGWPQAIASHHFAPQAVVNLQRFAHRLPQISPPPTTAWPLVCSHYPLLWDPQINGGHLGLVEKSQLPTCLQQLAAAGYAEAKVIGTINEGVSQGPQPEQTAASQRSHRVHS